MKKVVLIVLFIPSLLSAQISEDFEKGSCAGWIQYPVNRWSADPASPLSGSFSLHHTFDNTDNGADRIFIPLNNFHPDEGTSSWSFIAKHGYAPSSTNNWAVFLMSDAGAEMSFGAGTNGYAVGVNTTGYDDILKLVKIRDGTVTTVVNSGINWETQTGILQYAGVSVVRTTAGEWTLTVVKQDGSTLGSSTGVDAELFNTGYFGILYRYTATKDLLLWIDNITVSGLFYTDTEAPYVNDKNITGRNSVSISLSEKIVDTNLDPGNFIMNSVQAVSVKKTGETRVSLTFENDLINKQANTLLIKHLCDDAGNCSENITTDFLPVWAETGDIIITEIMADPSPVVSLPDAEYLEITNRTGLSFRMDKWKLFAGDNGYLIPDKKIDPGEILILCLQKDTSTFSAYGKTSGLKSFPSLLNEGMLLYITDSTGLMIHGIEYEQSWHADALKSDGGWSLEMKDKKYPFHGEQNWKASSSRKGGTPGTLNSIEGDCVDQVFGGMVNVFAADPLNVILQFSEPVIGQGDILANITINGEKIKSIKSVDPLRRTFMATLNTPLEINLFYELIIPGGVTDFAGNNSIISSFKFALTQTAAKDDIIINELLFDPLPAYPDFIELYNKSSKAIDASRLFLVSINDETSDTSELYQVSEEQRCILPGNYHVITTGKDLILKKYFSSFEPAIFEIETLPSMDDDKGHIVLLNRELDLIDEVRYEGKIQAGVSLERDSAGRWHSASATSGWGTPGKKNSSVQPDTTDPNILSITVADRNSLSVSFNEPIAEESMAPGNFSMNSVSAESVLTTGIASVRIIFPDNLINKKTNTFLVKQLCDSSGNCSENISVDINPVWPETGDVVITEIMSDPSPEVSLPGAEYIELTNRTGFVFSADNWKISTVDTDYPVPKFVIPPGGIIILCSEDDTSTFSRYGKAAGMKAFPALLNEGMKLYISDKDGFFLHGVEYDQSWYGDALKSSGGWSLEMIDKDFPFNVTGNWKASVSREGGTPGSLNSVSGHNPDNEFMGLLNVFASDKRNLLIEFSEPIIRQEDILINATVNGTKVKTVIPADPLFRSFVASTDDDLQNGVSYTLVVPGDLTDFVGNLISSAERSFAVTESALAGDIIFNELLFNPLPGYPDYIELYNCSGKPIDANRLYVISINDETSDTSDMYCISDEHRCILPGDYYVITTDRNSLIEKYFSSEPLMIFNISQLPSMPDDKGHLVLLNRELVRIDQIIYNEKMHYSLLDDYEGKSLERISAGYWHTATEIDGWGTPGKKNSGYDLSEANLPLAMSSTKITPNGDGFEDDLRVKLNFSDVDNVVSVTVFDEAGTLVKKIATNLLSGPEAIIVWDGTAADGTPVPTGIYIIFITYYNDKGDTGKWKKVCTVIRE